jgi:hypothetical protein
VSMPSAASPGFAMPALVERLQRNGLGVGAAGAVAGLLGLLLNADQFFRSYLFAYLFWAGISVGCLSILMIQHLSGGLWGLLIRRLLEAGARTVPFVALLFVPVLLGLPRLYVWARPAEVAADRVLQQKQLYLNVPFFVGRAAFYFASWAILAHFLSKWSLEQDVSESLRVARRLRGLSGGGLLVLGFTITFSSIDWAMSLNPHWFSTIYGILFMVGQVLSAMAVAIVLIALLGREKPLSDAVGRTVIHDLGKLLLAFVMLWAYVNLSQFLIVWSGNLPEEIPWYLARFQGGWQWLALVLVIFHFALPFLLLLSRDLKRNALALAQVAVGVLLVRLVDLFWLIAPDLQGAHGAHRAHALSVHWLDVALAVGLGGLWVFAFARQLRKHPLLPQGEPEVQDMIAAGAEAHP